MRIVTVSFVALSLAAAVGCHRVKTEPQGTERTAPAPTSYGGGPSTTDENKPSVDYEKQNQNLDQPPSNYDKPPVSSDQNVENKGDGNIQMGDGDKTAGPSDQMPPSTGGGPSTGGTPSPGGSPSTGGTDVDNNPPAGSDMSSSSSDMGQGGGPEANKDAGAPPKDGGAKNAPSKDMPPYYGTPPYGGGMP